MERGEKGGVILDGGNDSAGETGDEVASVNSVDAGSRKEVSDASLTSIEEDNQNVDEQGGTADLDGGAEDPQAGKDDSAQEGEVLEDGEIAGQKGDDRIAIVEKTLKEIHEKLNEQKPEPVKQMTDEEWAKLEQQTGAPRSTIEFFTNQNVKVVEKLTQYIDSKLAKLEFDSSLNDFSRTPGFQDAVRYKKDVQEFLSTYEPKHWTNPDLLKRAVIYSRGLHAGENVQKARTDSERNRKIAGAARPASPGGSARKSATPPLTQAQREVASMMPGGEAEYLKYRPKGGRVTLE